MKKEELFFMIFFHIMFGYLAVVTLAFKPLNLFSSWNFPLGVILVVVAAYYIIGNMYKIKERKSWAVLYAFMLLIDILFVCVMVAGVYSGL